METLIEKKLNDILKKELKKFKSYMLELDYEEFKDYSKEKMFSLYVYSLIENPIGLKKIKTKCLQNGINAKDFNDFIYLSMKWKDKQERGIYSWYEADYFNIDIEDWKETTLTYIIM